MLHLYVRIRMQYNPPHYQTIVQKHLKNLQETFVSCKFEETFVCHFMTEV